jgi:hypothetical protein
MTTQAKAVVAAAIMLLALPQGVRAQAGRGGRGPGGTAATPRADAPIDLTGYWVSLIVDEWRLRVEPQKGDIPYLPLNPQARQIANQWDPAKDEAEGNQCRAYGAVGVMQRPGRLHITWENDTTLRIDADAGTQTRRLHFGGAPAEKGAPSWQGNSVAQWQMAPQGRGTIDLGGASAPDGSQLQRARTGTLKVVTTNMLPGYIRKNGVPYSGNAVLTEYIQRLTGAQNDVYLTVTATVEDPAYLTGPFIRTYTFKSQADASGWDPTACLNR